MTEREACRLKPGDKVRHKFTGLVVEVVRVEGASVELALFQSMENIKDWEYLKRDFGTEIEGYTKRIRGVDQ